MAEYTKDFYQGMPALTEHTYVKGNAYYMTFRSDGDFLYDFYQDLIGNLKLHKFVDIEYSSDVMMKVRASSDQKYLFIMNFSIEERIISLPKGYHSYRSNKLDGNIATLDGYEFTILSQHKRSDTTNEVRSVDKHGIDT